MSKILIFDPSTNGHHLEWIGLVAEALAESFDEVVVATDFSDPRAVEVFASRPWGQQSLPSPVHKQETRRFAYLSMAEEARAACAADEVFFPFLDKLIPELAEDGVPDAAHLPGKLNGIWLKSSAALKQSSLHRFFDKRSRRVSRALGAMDGLRRGGRLGTVFFLDERCERPFADRFGKHLQWLPDPWLSCCELSQTEARKALELPEERVVFLHLGIDSRRKGIHDFAAAMEALPDAERERAFFVRAGRMDDAGYTADREPLRRLVDEGRARVEDAFIDDERMNCYLAACDWVVLPYHRHSGSSGLLTKAAAHLKPVIAAYYDLLGNRVERGKLGILFRMGDHESLVAAIRDALDRDPASFRSKIEIIRRRNQAPAFRETIARRMATDGRPS